MATPRPNTRTDFSYGGIPKDPLQEQSYSATESSFRSLPETITGEIGESTWMRWKDTSRSLEGIPKEIQQNEPPSLYTGYQTSGRLSSDQEVTRGGPITFAFDKDDISTAVPASFRASWNELGMYEHNSHDVKFTSTAMEPGEHEALPDYGLDLAIAKHSISSSTWQHVHAGTEASRNISYLHEPSPAYPTYHHTSDPGIHNPTWYPVPRPNGIIPDPGFFKNEMENPNGDILRYTQLAGSSAGCVSVGSKSPKICRVWTNTDCFGITIENRVGF